jgi:coproporphyrinogen III oxidase-like Fe-S oxidoreductase
MTETIEDYVEAYKKHKNLKQLYLSQGLSFKKEDSIMEHIIEGALLKFNIKRETFLKKVNE